MISFSSSDTDMVEEVVDNNTLDAQVEVDNNTQVDLDDDVCVSSFLQVVSDQAAVSQCDQESYLLSEETSMFSVYAPYVSLLSTLFVQLQTSVSSTAAQG